MPHITIWFSKVVTTFRRDGIDLTADEFYRKLGCSKTLPANSVPPLLTFAETYDKLAEETDQVLAIISSGLKRHLVDEIA